MVEVDQRQRVESAESDVPTTRSLERARLADAATALLSCRSAAEVFEVAAHFVASVSSRALVIVNDITPDGDYFITRELIGLDDTIMARAVKLVGFQIIGKRSVIVPKYRYQMTHPQLTRVEGGFADFAASEVSPTIGALATRLAGIRDVYTIGIADEDTVLGNIHVCMRLPDVAPPAQIIETFVRHCYSALAGLAIARNLEQSNKQFRLAIQTSTDGFWSVDATGHLVAVNQAYCQMSGFTEQELVGMHVSELVVSESPAAMEARRQAIMACGHESFESVHRRKDGTLYDVELSVSYVQADGGQLTAFIRDITERKQTENALLRLNADLEERVQERTEELTATNAELRRANVELEEATRAKSDFLASMSHELRTPLNSIIGFSGILLQGMAGPMNHEQKQQLHMVSESGKHLLSLINDILDLAKIEAGRTVAHLEMIDVATLVEEAMAMIRPLAAEKNLELTLDCAACAHRIRSDPRLLEQILINLLGNAIKFTDFGRVSLTVSFDREDAVFVVADTGRGISEEDLPHIMETFYQAASTTEAKTAGTGLGLAISARLATVLGGRLEVTSELHVGSLFTLRLPRGGPL